jgi:hypothetical protein
MRASLGELDTVECTAGSRADDVGLAVDVFR